MKEFNLKNFSNLFLSKVLICLCFGDLIPSAGWISPATVIFLLGWQVSKHQLTPLTTNLLRMRFPGAPIYTEGPDYEANVLWLKTIDSFRDTCDDGRGMDFLCGFSGHIKHNFTVSPDFMGELGLELIAGSGLETRLLLFERSVWWVMYGAIKGRFNLDFGFPLCFDLDWFAEREWLQPAVQ